VRLPLRSADCLAAQVNGNTGTGAGETAGATGPVTRCGQVG
jgi:hypothetical protein